MKYAIEVKNIKKYFRFFKKDYMVFYWLFTKKGYTKEFKVLDDISFKLKKGEIVGILGRNGAGKSTLLKIISGIYYPTSGSVKVDGTIASLIELGAGFERELTGRENIYLKGFLMGLSEEYLDDHIQDIIDFADIGEYIDMPLRTYSSGMGARIGFSLAVFTQPDILIIDEVFAVGDKNFQKKSRAKTEELLRSGKTVLFVSHSEDLIRSFCTRVMYLKDGKIVYDGEIEQGIKTYHADNLNIPKVNSISFNEYEIIDNVEDVEKQVRIRFDYGLFAELDYVGKARSQDFEIKIARYNINEKNCSEPNLFAIKKIEKISNQLLDVYINLSDVIDGGYFTFVYNHISFTTSDEYKNSINQIELDDDLENYNVSVKNTNNDFVFKIDNIKDE